MKENTQNFISEFLSKNMCELVVNFNICLYQTAQIILENPIECLNLNVYALSTSDYFFFQFHNIRSERIIFKIKLSFQ